MPIKAFQAKRRLNVIFLTHHKSILKEIRTPLAAIIHTLAQFRDFFRCLIIFKLRASETKSDFVATLVVDTLAVGPNVDLVARG